eukprot:PLAT11195.1.p1 GENE.PLAT11195.1~~PLAT11195.1.p1  ORF type:complete len:962 (-),score=537.95 PLAT11195.1:1455-4340(-)
MALVTSLGGRTTPSHAARAASALEMKAIPADEGGVAAAAGDEKAELTRPSTTAARLSSHGEGEEAEEMEDVLLDDGERCPPPCDGDVVSPPLLSGTSIGHSLRARASALTRTRVYTLALVGVAICDVLSLLALALASVKTVERTLGERFFLLLDALFCTVFTLELIARAIHRGSFRAFFSSAEDVLSLLATMPLYVKFILLAAFQQTPAVLQAISITQVMRCLRALVMSRFVPGTSVLWKAARSSWRVLLVPTYLLFLLCVMLGTVLVVIEQGEPDGSFQDIMNGGFFVVVTMTTVGYGDQVPVTTAGRLVTCMAVIAGVLFLAMPFTIVGNNFYDAWEAEKVQARSMADLLKHTLTKREQLQHTYMQVGGQLYGMKGKLEEAGELTADSAPKLRLPLLQLSTYLTRLVEMVAHFKKMKTASEGARKMSMMRRHSVFKPIQLPTIRPLRIDDAEDEDDDGDIDDDGAAPSDSTADSGDIADAMGIAADGDDADGDDADDADARRRKSEARAAAARSALRQRTPQLLSFRMAAEELATLERRPPGGNWQLVRRRLHALLVVRRSRSSQRLDDALLWIVLFSIVVFGAETVESLRHWPWFWLELCFGCIFTVELLARTAAAVDHAAFFKYYLTIIDCIVVLQFILEMALVPIDGHHLRWDPEATTALNVLRVLRVMRILKAFRHFELAAHVLYSAISSALPVLIAPFYFLAIFLYIFGTLLYIMERGYWDDASDAWVVAPGQPSEFTDIIRTMWFVLTTMTSVGYGNFVPQTVAGRGLTVLVMLFGVVYMAMPLTIMGNHFWIAWRKYVTQDDELGVPLSHDETVVLLEFEHFARDVTRDISAVTVQLKRLSDSALPCRLLKSPSAVRRLLPGQVVASSPDKRGGAFVDGVKAIDPSPMEGLLEVEESDSASDSGRDGAADPVVERLRAATQERLTRLSAHLIKLHGSHCRMMPLVDRIVFGY